MKLYFFLFIIISVKVFGQNPNDGKDFHERIPTGIDVLLEKNNPKGFKSLTTKDNFLVISNYRNGKRWRYFEGEMFRFKSKEGDFFQEEIAYINDSSFVIQRYNIDINRMEEFAFKPSDVSSVFKNKRGKAYKPALVSMAGIVPFALIDWARGGKHPFANRDFLVITPIIGLGNTLIFGFKNLFNKQKMGNNKDVRIIKPL